MVFINIVTWNSMKYLPDALRSIFSQTYKNFKVLIIDNGSNDDLFSFLKSEYPQILVLRNAKNLGFAAAHNQGIKIALSFCDKNNYNPQKSYALIVNPDIILEPTFLEKIIFCADNKNDGGSFGGKLLKVYGEKDAGQCFSLIDSTGLKIFKNRRVVERGAGEKDENQFISGEVFGNSAALVLYRLSALQDVEIKGKYFDTAYFSYKEDVDLAWRLRLLGWKAFYENKAIAHHHRGAYGSEKRALRTAIRERRVKNQLVNYYSTCNHLLTLFKNEFLENVFKDFLQIFFYESAKFFYCLFFEPKIMGAYFKFFKFLPYALGWRREIMARKKINEEDMRRWIN